MKLTIKNLCIFTSLILMVNQAHGWWLTDWMFGKSNEQSHVEIKKASTDLLLVAAAAVAIPSCWLGYKLYKMHEKNSQLLRDNDKFDKDLTQAHAELHKQDLLIQQKIQQRRALQNSLESQINAEKAAHATTRVYYRVANANLARYQEAYQNNTEQAPKAQSYIQKSREQKADKFRKKKFFKKWNALYRYNFPERNGEVL